MDLSILDSDILSELLKRQNKFVLQNAAQYLRHHTRLTFSINSRFEVLRGLKERHAKQQIQRFLSFCDHSIVRPLSDQIFDRAADLWAFARQNGHPCADADILIAATAIETQHTLITGNYGPFQLDTQSKDR